MAEEGSNMNAIEARNLQNQLTLLWAAHYTIKRLSPELLGIGGDTDRILDDLVRAAKETKRMLESKA